MIEHKFKCYYLSDYFYNTKCLKCRQLLNTILLRIPRKLRNNELEDLMVKIKYNRILSNGEFTSKCYIEKFEQRLSEMYPCTITDSEYEFRQLLK